jgi:hypothetical protein
MASSYLLIHNFTISISSGGIGYHKGLLNYTQMRHDDLTRNPSIALKAEEGRKVQADVLADLLQA